jgi:hypothetical protein
MLTVFDETAPAADFLAPETCFGAAVALVEVFFVAGSFEVFFVVGSFVVFFVFRAAMLGC